MYNQRVSAVFDSREQAERAVSALRQLGVNDTHIALVGRQDPVETVTTHGDDVAERTGKGLAAGAGVGAIFGLAAALIPGVGPFITAGWLASALGVTAGAAVAGAVVGGTSGALAGALIDNGYTEQDAHYYGSAVEQGGTLVTVGIDNTPLTERQISDTLAQYGGRFSTAAV